MTKNSFVADVIFNLTKFIIKNYDMESAICFISLFYNSAKKKGDSIVKFISGYWWFKYSKKVLSFVFDFKHAKDIKIIYVSKNFTFLEIFLAVLSMSYEQLWRNRAQRKPHWNPVLNYDKYTSQVRILCSRLYWFMQLPLQKNRMWRLY